MGTQTDVLHRMCPLIFNKSLGIHSSRTEIHLLNCSRWATIRVYLNPRLVQSQNSEHSVYEVNKGRKLEEGESSPTLYRPLYLPLFLK